MERQSNTQRQRDRKNWQNQFVVPHDYAKIARDFRNGRWRRVSRLGRIAEEQQYEEEHRKHAEGRHAVDIFHTEMAMRPGSKQWAEGAAYVDHGVVNRVSNGAHVFFGRTRRRADDAWLYQRHAECWKHENESDEETKRHKVTDGRKPGRSDGADQKICNC